MKTADRGLKWSHVLRSRPLSFEQLESRILLDGALGPDQYFTPMVTDSARVDDWGKYASQSLTDKQYLTITVEVHSQHAKLVELQGSIANLQGTKQIRSGEVADLKIDVKSADQVLASDSLVRRSLERDRLYGTYVKITETLYEDTRLPGSPFPFWTYSDTRLLWYIPYRYISAVFSDFPTADAILQFEPTRPSTVDAYANRKSIDIFSPFDVTPSNPEGPLFDTLIGGSPAGQNSITIKYWPQVNAAASHSATITLLTGPTFPGKAIGNLKINGSVRAIPTWWIDESLLAARLEQFFAFPPADFGAMASRIVNNIDTRYANSQQLATRVFDEDSAQITVDILSADSSITVGRVAGHTLHTHGYDLAVGLQQASVNYDAENLAQRSARLGDLVSLAATGRSRIWINLRAIPRAELEPLLIRTISHEIAHAMGFPGHIVPPTAADSPSPKWDIMQQGVPVVPYTLAQFSFIESAPLLQLLVGVGWTNTTTVNSAVARLRLPSPNGRRHDLGSADGDFNDDLTTDAADYLYWKSNFGLISEVGGGADGNYNGFVDAADYTIWKDRLGKSATSQVTIAAKLVEPSQLLAVPDHSIGVDFLFTGRLLDRPPIDEPRDPPHLVREAKKLSARKDLPNHALLNHAMDLSRRKASRRQLDISRSFTIDIPNSTDSNLLAATENSSPSHRLKAIDEYFSLSDLLQR